MYRKDINSNDDHISSNECMHKLSTYMHWYKYIDDRVKYMWEAKDIHHFAQHIFVEYTIFDSLYQKPHKSWMRFR